MLQWTQARTLRVLDGHNVAVSLFQRIDEMSELSELTVLILALQPDSYDQINVATLFDKLPKLKSIAFNAENLAIAQMEEFHAKNPPPPTCKCRIIDDIILYYPAAMDVNAFLESFATTVYFT